MVGVGSVFSNWNIEWVSFAHELAVTWRSKQGVFNRFCCVVTVTVAKGFPIATRTEPLERAPLYLGARCAVRMTVATPLKKSIRHQEFASPTLVSLF